MSSLLMRAMLFKRSKAGCDDRKLQSFCHCTCLQGHSLALFGDRFIRRTRRTADGKSFVASSRLLLTPADDGVLEMIMIGNDRQLKSGISSFIVLSSLFVAIFLCNIAFLSTFLFLTPKIMTMKVF